MKKIFLIIAILVSFGIFTSCTKHQEIPIGTKPTKDFTVIDYISDNGIYQADSPLEISGDCEPGVVMVCKFKNNKGNVIEEKYVTANEMGKWKIIIDDTPRPSSKKYQLVISTAKDEFVKQFENIRFGESWLLIGDELEEQRGIKIAENIFDNENYMIYKDGTWQKFSNDNQTFAMFLLNELANSTSVPISIVDATVRKATKAYQWLDSKLIESRPQVKAYLEKNGLYKDNVQNLTENDMSYYAINNYEKIKNMAFKNLVWNQGSGDYIEDTDNEYKKLYGQMLFTIMSQFEEKFKTTNNFYIIQEGSSFNEDVNLLRGFQTSICNYFAQCKVIPTYDLNIVYDNLQEKFVGSTEVNEEDLVNYEIRGYDLPTLAKRIELIDKNKVIVPTVKNVIRELDEDKNIISIKLIFDIELNFANLETAKIKGLKFYDKNNQLVECEYVFEKNEITIKPVLKEVSDETGDTVEKTTFSIYKITYAEESFIFDNNFIVNNIVVVPFIVVIK